MNIQEYRKRKYAFKQICGQALDFCQKGINTKESYENACNVFIMLREIKEKASRAGKEAGMLQDALKSILEKLNQVQYKASKEKIEGSDGEANINRMMRQARHIIENGITDDNQEKAADALRDELYERLSDISNRATASRQGLELKAAFSSMVLMLDKKLVEYESVRYSYDD